MSSLGTAVVALGSGIPGDASSLAISIGPALSDLMTGLGAIALGTLGGLLLRQVATLGERRDPSEPATSPNPRGDDLKQAA